MSIQPKSIPYGISNYKTIIDDGYAYVDKTMYIETLENAGVHNLFLRPRRFGKSLFTSMLGYYYDINERDNFDVLFSNTYIGKNPTDEKNTYYVMKFNFSGIRTDSEILLCEDFSSRIQDTLIAFCRKYHLDIAVEANGPQAQTFQVFSHFQNISNGKIYVIIDEYDHFANDLLSFNPDLLKTSVSKGGFIRTWYEVLKIGSETVVNRIFITGVTPIALDNLTSGFSTATNISMDSDFNEMAGFTKKEVQQLIKETISQEPPSDFMDTLTEYYNGYLFSKDAKERVFNSTMVLYYLKHYQRKQKPPEQLLDKNAVSDYGKLEKLMTFQTPQPNINILKDVIFQGYTDADLIESFYIDQEFTEEHFKSLLFYLGLLTVKDPKPGPVILQIPNYVIKGLYFEFLMTIISNEIRYTPDTGEIMGAMRELAYSNSCDLFVGLIEKFLHSFSNRDYRNFNEKYIKVAMALYASISKLFIIKYEYEVEEGYADLVFFPIENTLGQNIILFELKYIPKGKKTEEKIEEKLAEAMTQIERYRKARELKGKKITCFAIVFAGDKCVRQVKVE